MVQIITDSSSDITLAQAAKMGVEMIPIAVQFGDEEFMDGDTMLAEEFYRRLRQ